jgi:hypothetical protein
MKSFTILSLQEYGLFAQGLLLKDEKALKSDR